MKCRGLQRERSTNYDIVIRKSQRWSRCSGHDQSKTLVGKELNFSKLYWHSDHEEGWSVNPLSYNTNCTLCGRCPIGILRNSRDIVFKLLYKLRPALTHRPTLTLSSMLRFFSQCILLFLIAKTKIELRKIPSGWGKWGKGRVYSRGGGGVLLGILGGGVPPGSSNPDPISDQKMWFSSLVFTLDL